MGKVKRLVLIIAATISLVFTPVAAQASFTLLQCDGTGKAVAGTALFNADPANDPAEGRGQCQYANRPAIQHVFSLIICKFVTILNIIMNDMYCGIHYYLINIVAALLTLYITIYGAQILMGSAQLSTRDAVIRMLKVSFIYVFATQSQYGISFIFRFFIGFINDAGYAILKVLQTKITSTGDGVCDFIGLQSNDYMSMYEYLDYLVCHSLIGPASEANTKVQGFMLAMIVTLPPMTMLFQWWIMTTIKTLVRTLVTFLKALAGIAFLTTLSPVFLGFFLFESTTYLFNNWLRYLTAFAVQIVLVVSIVVFWVMTIDQFVGFFNDLSKMIYPYEQVHCIGGVCKPSNGWAVCEGKYTVDTDGFPRAECAPPKRVAKTPDWTGYVRSKDCEKGARAKAFDATPPKCTEDVSVTPKIVTCEPPANEHWQCDNEDLFPPARVVNQGEFLYYIFFHIFTLLLISYCFSVLLEKTSDIARSLSGADFGPKLIPGFGNSLGSAKGFKAPGFAGPGAAPGSSTKNLGLNFHKMVGNR